MIAPTFSFDAIGTHWQIEINDFLSEEERDSLLNKIKERIESFDKAYSRFREDSLVTEMSRNTGVYRLPVDADMLFSHYKKFYDVTDGRVTPLIGDVLSDAGYDAKYSLIQSKPLTAPLLWDDVLEYQYPNLIMKKTAMLDFGAGGKGYLIDIVASLLEKEGISTYCIDAGGDILTRGGQPLIIGLEDPNDSSKVIGKVALSNQSIAGSAGNRRVWGEFHHIIDPVTLQSPKHILGLWVIADTTILADLLATALFFISPEELSKQFDFEFMIVNPDYSVITSDGFSAELFSDA